MIAVTNKNFATNREKYLDTVNAKEQPILKPDDDLRRAIPLEKVRDKMIDYIHKKHANRV